MQTVSSCRLTLSPKEDNILDSITHFYCNPSNCVHDYNNIAQLIHKRSIIVELSDQSHIQTKTFTITKEAIRQHMQIILQRDNKVACKDLNGKTITDWHTFYSIKEEKQKYAHPCVTRFEICERKREEFHLFSIDHILPADWETKYQ